MRASYMRRRRLAAIAVGIALAGPIRADVVTDWNETAVQTTSVSPNSVLQARALAITHLAILDAVGAVRGRSRPGGVEVKAPPGASAEAAAAAAGYGVLTRLTTGQQEALEAALRTSLDPIPAGQPKTDGIAVGTEVAERWVALRKGDGADAKVVHTPAAGVGRWQPTPPSFAPGILAQWGAVKPFLLASATQFEAKGPPEPSSPAFARDLEEVRSVGARLSTTRTADQTAAAIFWTVQTLVPWNAAARAAAAARGTGLDDNARLLAAMNAACSDAHVVGFEIKYRRPHWRPVTAIRARAAPGSADGSWEPLLMTPRHPEYPSAHALCSGAAEAVLKGSFGRDQVQVSVTHPPNFGVTRTYTSFSQIAQEVDDARVWGGIHFRTADVDGHDLGRRIGEHVLRSVSSPVAAR